MSGVSNKFPIRWCLSRDKKTPCDNDGWYFADSRLTAVKAGLSKAYPYYQRECDGSFRYLERDGDTSIISLNADDKMVLIIQSVQEEAV